MWIRLNGERREVPVVTAQELLAWLEAPQAGVALAVNGQIVRAAERLTRRLEEDDEVEVIHAVQGG